jgi:hypothetical protein
VNGRTAAEGPDLRLGHRQTIDGEDLIIWLRTEARTDLHLSVEAR